MPIRQTCVSSAMSAKMFEYRDLFCILGYCRPHLPSPSNPNSLGIDMIPKDFLTSTIAKAKSLKKRIVLPDATDERAIQAARILIDQQIVCPTLIGDPDTIRQQAAKVGVRLDGIDIVNPRSSDKLEGFARTFCEIRKAKGLQLEEA